MAPDDALTDGLAALEQGCWSRACDALARLPDDPRALAGWASALWWLGENDASTERCLQGKLREPAGRRRLARPRRTAARTP